MAIYAHDNFQQIAAAIGMEVEEIAKHAQLFEEAARWYRLDSASPDRPAPSTLCRKLDQIAKNARRLLKSLSVNDLDEAVDGPGDPQIFDALILLDDRDETPITRATQRIARLVEIVEAVAAAAELSRRAEQAAAEIAKVGMAAGPLIRFLAATGAPLQIKFLEDAWRSRVRTVLKGASPQD